jgi:hypothetical protein
VHFIGPLLPETPADFDPPPWWHEVTPSRRPVVLVTQGTMATNPRDLLLPALALRHCKLRSAPTTRRARPPRCSGNWPNRARPFCAPSPL